MTQPPERTRINQPRKPLIEPYKDYLINRWNQGCRNAQQVHRELKELGYTRSDQPIVRYFARFRTQKDARKFKQVDPATQTLVKAPPKRPPTAFQLAHWITFKEEQPLDWQQKYLNQLCEADQEIREAYDLSADFTTMLREQEGERLDIWLGKAEAQGCAVLRSFAQSLTRDYDAVKAGLTLQWNHDYVA